MFLRECGPDREDEGFFVTTAIRLALDDPDSVIGTLNDTGVALVKASGEVS